MRSFSRGLFKTTTQGLSDRFGSRDGRFRWRLIPFGLGGGLFVLNTVRKAKFEDLFSKLIDNLMTDTNSGVPVSEL